MFVARVLSRILHVFVLHQSYTNMWCCSWYKKAYTLVVAKNYHHSLRSDENCNVDGMSLCESFNFESRQRLQTDCALS
jgi:hypothetical protein